MVCVAIKGVPVIGAIYKPFTEEMSWTWLSTASSPNLKQFSVCYVLILLLNYTLLKYITDVSF